MTYDTLQVYDRYDPTRTTSLRNQFASKMNGRFREIAMVIRQAVVERDCFGLQEGPVTMQMTPPGWRQFDFAMDAQKIEAFVVWLYEQVEKGILELRYIPQVGAAWQEPWTNIYVWDSYKRGVIRARQELIRAGYSVPTMEATGGIEASMSTPFHIDRVGVLFTRVFADLKGITDAMAHHIGRVLAQGMIDGDGPRLIARKLISVINGKDVGELGIRDSLGRFIPAKRRAELLARTEIIRAHHLATIQEYRNWGAVGVKVRAEWATAGDDRVCARCASLEGVVYTLDAIEAMIPLHPLCRCIALPVISK